MREKIEIIKKNNKILNFELMDFVPFFYWFDKFSPDNSSSVCLFNLK